MGGLKKKKKKKIDWNTSFDKLSQENEKALSPFYHKKLFCSQAKCFYILQNQIYVF